MSKTKIKKIWRALAALVVFVLLFAFFTPTGAHEDDLAFAEQINVGDGPYSKFFTISAYYSPLPCQNRYVTGSYEGDIRLNGRGVNGADGTPVYPGMVAAPREYDFGTKMHIPGVGIVSVHDRGGAIKSSSGVPGVYDRLDIWMGYGDKGLKRALNWGKRTVDVVIYGINGEITEQIILDDYSPGESQANICAEIAKPAQSETVPEVSRKLTNNLQRGSSGPAVQSLQQELKRLNFFKVEVTGYYGELTEHAVYKFQQSQKLVGDQNSLGSGIFGNKTRDRMNEIVVAREYSKVLIAEVTSQKSDFVAKNDAESRLASD